MTLLASVVHGEYSVWPKVRHTLLVRVSGRNCKKCLMSVHSMYVLCRVIWNSVTWLELFLCPVSAKKWLSATVKFIHLNAVYLRSTVLFDRLYWLIATNNAVAGSLLGDWYEDSGRRVMLGFRLRFIGSTRLQSRRQETRTSCKLSEEGMNAPEIP